MIDLNLIIGWIYIFWNDGHPFWRMLGPTPWIIILIVVGIPITYLVLNHIKIKVNIPQKHIKYTNIQNPKIIPQSNPIIINIPLQSKSVHNPSIPQNEYPKYQNPNIIKRPKSFEQYQARIERGKETYIEIPPLLSELDQVIAIIKQFRPTLNEIGRVSDEVLNCKHLSTLLKSKGFITSVEGSLPNQKRGDLVINNKILIEAKRSLMNDDKLSSLRTQIERRNETTKYELVVLILGRARIDLLKDLNKKVGSMISKTVVLGEIVNKNERKHSNGVKY